jgi:hypothetical protein
VAGLGVGGAAAAGLYMNYRARDVYVYETYEEELVEGEGSDFYDEENYEE